MYPPSKTSNHPCPDFPSSRGLGPIDRPVYRRLSILNHVGQTPHSSRRLHTLSTINRLGKPIKGVLDNRGNVGIPNYCHERLVVHTEHAVGARVPVRDYKLHVLVDAGLLPADLVLARALPMPLGDVAATVGVGRHRAGPLSCCRGRCPADRRRPWLIIRDWA